MKDPETMRDTQVNKAMHEFGEIFVEMEQAIGALEARLSAVLVTEAEEKTSSENVVPGILVPLATELRRQNNEMRGLLVKLNNMRNRIEL